MRSPAKSTSQTTVQPARHSIFGRSGYLLIALLLLLFAYPFFFDDAFWHRLAIGVLNLAILLTAARAALPKRSTFLLVVAGLGGPALGLQVYYLLTKNGVTADLLALTYAIFYGFTIIHVLRHVLAPGVVDGDKICGAIAAYILTTLLWSTSYMLLNSVSPGSFSSADGQSAALEPGDFIYFSFTTLTTTGYGDIVPRSAHARSLAILEQLAGTFYIAILIARLTGLYQGRMNRRPD